MVSHSPGPQRFFRWIEYVLEFWEQQHAGSHSAAAPCMYRGCRGGDAKIQPPLYSLALSQHNLQFDADILPVDDRKKLIQGS